MLAAIVQALDGAALVVPARLPIADTIAAIEATVAPVVLLLVAADLPPVERAMLLAAIGPLAVRLAPRRLSALDLAGGAAVDDVIAAATFLAGAASTTGQVLHIA